MKDRFFYTAGESAALKIAAARLQAAGCSFLPQPDNRITHLLLPVPSLDSAGLIKGGIDPTVLFSGLPKGIPVFGGNLPEIEGFQVRDLLRDDGYVAENAYITAHCAVAMAMNRLPIVFRDCEVLVIGWGRIGKCLAALMKSMEAKVTVAARRDSHRGMLQALGYRAIPTENLTGAGYTVIFNTVAAPVLPCPPEDALLIDLASVRGIGGDRVLWTRGLPEKAAPEASGELIARTVLKFLEQERIV